MKLLRSVTRRGFEVGTAGWFTITSPRRWFSASSLPSGFQDFLDRPKRTEARVIPFPPSPEGDPTAADRANRPDAAPPLQLINPSAQDHRLMRMVLIALIAAALTLLVLWWLTPNSWYQGDYKNIF